MEWISIGDMVVLKGDVVYIWFGEVFFGSVCVAVDVGCVVGWVAGLGAEFLFLVLNLFLLISRSCLSCCIRLYWGVAGISGVGAQVGRIIIVGVIPSHGVLSELLAVNFIVILSRLLAVIVILSELLAVFVVLSELLAVIIGVFSGVGEGDVVGIVHRVLFGVCGYAGDAFGSLVVLSSLFAAFGVLSELFAVIKFLSELFAAVAGLFSDVGGGSMAGVVHITSFGVR